MSTNPLVALSLIFLVVCAVQSEDKGFLRNCGSKIFSMDWTPKTIKNSVTYTLNLNAEAAKTFTRGQLCWSIWIRGDSDSFLDKCQDVSCAELLEFVNIPLSCPIQQGEKLDQANFQKTIDPDTFPLGGQFYVNATLDNENNERFLCFTGDIDVGDD